MRGSEVAILIFASVFFLVSIVFTVVYVGVVEERMIDLMTLNLNGLKV